MADTKKPSGKDSFSKTKQGVAFAPERYEPGTALIEETDVEGYYRLSLDDIVFLDAYAEHKADFKAIQAATGFNKKKVENMLQQERIRAEIAELQEVWRLNRKMTAEHAAAKHIKLMGELEKDYHLIDDPVERSKMANPRVKASETYLRAAGHFSKNADTEAGNIMINIDLGDDEVEISKGGEKASVKRKKKGETNE